MSIRIEIIGDTVAEIVQTLRDTLAAFTPLTSLSVSVVDTNKQKEDTSIVAADPVPAHRAEAKEPEPDAAMPEPLSLEVMLSLLTTAYRNGDDTLRARIVALRDQLGLKLLSQAKTEEHIAAYRAFIANEGIAS